MQALTDKEILQLFRDKNINPDLLENMVVEKLMQNNKKIATAESCTGGLLSKRITEVSGASNVFDCGICSYSNEIKHKILGVKQDTLDILGAVSAETAIQMAEGVRRISGADIAVSTTGIAGPAGGTPEKPVGLVFAGICTRDAAYAIKLLLGGENRKINSRSYIRKLACDAVLYTVLNLI